jgi:hypothetical protein
MRRTWVKLWVDQCLRGSMIAELTPEQRWIFVGLLLLAGDSEVAGTLFRRKDANGELVGPSDFYLADTLGVQEEAIGPALDRMIEKTKISRDAQGVIRIVNWSKYQSDYERTKDSPSRSTKVPPEEVQKYGVEGEGDRDREGEEERVADALSKWNRFAHGHALPKAKEAPKGSARRRALVQRLNTKGFDFEELLRAIHEQPFLYGDNDRGWLVTIDWVLKPSNLIKIMERAYVKEVRGRARDRQPEDPHVGGRR